MKNVPAQSHDPIEQHFRLSPAQKSALKKLSLATVRDLLYHFPARHIDAGKASAIENAEDGERVTLYGTVEKTGTKKSFRGRVPMGEATVSDATGRVKLLWFHQPYMAKMLAVGDIVRVSGIVKKKNSGTAVINPEVEKVPEVPLAFSASLFADSSGGSDARFFGVYPESRGISSRWFYHATRKLIAENAHARMPDPIPDEILKKYNLPSLETALVWIHSPREEKHSLSARKRFAFEEIFLIQLMRQEARKRYEDNPSFVIEPDRDDLRTFIDGFGFPLTRAQEHALDAVFHDFTLPRPMLRLLEGDVGSGKTAIAAATAYAAVTTRPKGQTFGNLQVAYMCPTEILATQHFESFIKFFVDSGVAIGLITGSGCRKFPSKVDPSGWTDISRTQFLKWVGNGEIPIVIGTHALIQKRVAFKHLAYVVIDEQHRFGAGQRAKLVQKENGKSVAPHLLSMTATPIPRTLALTLYGDLDLTLLDEMPAGRKPVQTRVVSGKGRTEVYEKIRTEVRSGRQAYVICPRIDEPDPTKELALEARSVVAEAARLKRDIFPEFTIGILHSKMKPDDKDEVMRAFADGSTQILCATSVVEVGVNVPNATVILIEGAERFGLAQLHQLRGRVMRSTHQSYCYLFTGTNGAKAADRLRALSSAKNGFELAEMDLALRGAGELGGGRQWGISDVGMEAIRNIKMVEAAREEARALLDRDPELSRYPALRGLIANGVETHFE